MRQGVPMLDVIDLFSGAGGMSAGLREAGLSIRGGFDVNPYCVATFQQNFPGAVAVRSCVSELSAAEIAALARPGRRLVLAGCPPCQLFSQLHRSERPVGEEFGHYLRLVWAIRPDYIVFENVPRIVDYADAWNLLLSRLSRRGYYFDYRVVAADRLGVPQSRKRLVLVAAKTPIVLNDPPTARTKTVREAIGAYPEAESGIPNHITMRLSKTNLLRLRKVPKDGGRSKQLRTAFDDSYGRMRWDVPAPTITTRCVSFSNGRFGHPEFNRAITVREAAALQGFDDGFVFVGGVWETAKQVGNAVPPPVAKWLGEVIHRHWRETAIHRKRRK
jgi:DNA (cytosine-5)-methyltransferase 1